MGPTEPAAGFLPVGAWGLQKRFLIEETVSMRSVASAMTASILHAVFSRRLVALPTFAIGTRRPCLQSFSENMRVRSNVLEPEIAHHSPHVIDTELVTIR